MRIRIFIGSAVWAAALLSLLLHPADAHAAADGGAVEVDRDLLAAFERPAAVPFPADNPYTPEKAALGERLFHDPRLSGADDRSCASCHIPERGFEDGLPTGAAIDGTPLGRRVPTILNAAWGALFFWDGRADGLEDQALGPVQNPREMNQTLPELVGELKADPDLVAAFATAFPDRPEITADTIAAALATFERTVVSGIAPFDRWVAGDDGAVSAAAKRGFALFTGEAGCVSCHSGWAFTDNAFHDIGLPDPDVGRGEILGMAELNHAFKTPTLRDLGARGPYMHNGMLTTLEQVVGHYAHVRDMTHAMDASHAMHHGKAHPETVTRASLSPDLPKVDLSAQDQADLVAFLMSLDADAAPPPFRAETIGLPATTVTTTEISQKDKQFQPGAITVKVGATVHVLNDDTRSHNVRVDDPKLTLNSGYQDPGQSVELSFPEAGTYHVFCGIHPKMELVVTAE
ncbi:cytochrome c peroxidase [Caenispirillum bisanense]|uniref:Cytochrome c peroxidase n=1 Tax=Caenispirillum bisanense TaxID=414052 RepID=A0A286G6X9_9PROT|nr:cytochrome c peroxidase [Caenispirillum bisanense]SOD90724.1 cytochrome c peroxidase [Caenispirillum bisanense]